MTPLLGIHHVTAIAGDPSSNVAFYAGVLGLRLVKKTVNFDDPETYHLYFGDEVGHPGTIMTFFPWPGAMRTAWRRTTHSHFVRRAATGARLLE
jgi:glyoxalase family protein